MFQMNTNNKLQFDNHLNQEYGCWKIILMLGVFILGWIVYGSVSAGFWSVFILILLDLTALIGLVPIAGPYLYWKVATTSVLPIALEMANLRESWLTTLALWFGLIASIFITFASLYAFWLSIETAQDVVREVESNHQTVSEMEQLLTLLTQPHASISCHQCKFTSNAEDFADGQCPRCCRWIILPNSLEV